MALETATYINQLNAANPLGSDPIASGDDHIRLIKSAVKATFPNVTGPVTMTQDELNSIPDLATEAYVDAATASGRILQVVSAKFTNSTQTSGTSYVDTFSTLTITPQSTTSKIIVLTEAMVAKWDYSGAAIVRLVRGSTPIIGDHYLWASNGFSAAPYQTYTSMTLQTVDSPNTTSPVTYKVQLKNYANVASAGVSMYGAFDVDGATMTLIEVSQ